MSFLSSLLGGVKDIGTSAIQSTLAQAQIAEQKRQQQQQQVMALLKSGFVPGQGNGGARQTGSRAGDFLQNALLGPRDLDPSKVQMASFHPANLAEKERAFKAAENKANRDSYSAIERDRLAEEKRHNKAAEKNAQTDAATQKIRAEAAKLAAHTANLKAETDRLKAGLLSPEEQSVVMNNISRVQDRIEELEDWWGVFNSEEENAELASLKIALKGMLSEVESAKLVPGEGKARGSTEGEAMEELDKVIKDIEARGVAVPKEEKEVMPTPRGDHYIGEGANILDLVLPWVQAEADRPKERRR